MAYTHYSLGPADKFPGTPQTHTTNYGTGRRDGKRVHSLHRPTPLTACQILGWYAA